MLKIIWSYAPCESSQVKIKKKTSNTVEINQSSRKQRCFVYICQIKLIAFTASVSSYHLEGQYAQYEFRSYKLHVES